MSLERPFKVFAGRSNPVLGQKVASMLDKQLGESLLESFADGEIRFEINSSVRGLDTYVLQSTCKPSNQNIMELMIMGDALKRASARSVNAIIPYYGYARQDRKTAPRTPITAKLVADLLESSGFNRIITVDLHAGQIQGFFNCPVDHLFFGSPIAIPYLKEKYANDKFTVVSPDAGGTERARIYAKRLNDCPLAIVDKRRTAPGEAQAMNLIGDVEGKMALIVDDMIDTGGTLCKAADLIRSKGATRIVACATHPVFSGPALERLQSGDFDEIIVSDTIPLDEKFNNIKNLTVLSTDHLISETIKRIQRNDSISALID